MAKPLQSLNQELQRHRATAEESLAKVRVLPTGREAPDEERSRATSLQQALMQGRMELEVLLERRPLGPTRTAYPERLRWTGARERAKDERMEVLVHAANPTVAVLVHFRSPSDPTMVAAYPRMTESLTMSTR